MNRLLILGLTFFCALPAFAGREGGGGAGVLTKDGKIRSLPEAGLNIQFKDYGDDPYYLDVDTIRATQELSRQVAAGLRPTERDRNRYNELVFGPAHKYQRVDLGTPQNQALYRKLKAQYQKFIDQLPSMVEGVAIDKRSFVLLAYTEKCTTYLFPDFFAEEKGMDAWKRAKYLLHEAAFFHATCFNGNAPIVPLVNVLYADSAIENYLRAPQDLRQIWNLRKAVHKLGFELYSDATPITDGYVYTFHDRAFYIRYLQSQGITVTLDMIVGEIDFCSIRGYIPDWVDYPVYRYPNAFSADSIALQTHAHIDPLFKRIFWESSLSFGGHETAWVACRLRRHFASNFILQYAENGSINFRPIDRRFRVTQQSPAYSPYSNYRLPAEMPDVPGAFNWKP